MEWSAKLAKAGIAPKTPTWNNTVFFPSDVFIPKLEEWMDSYDPDNEPVLRRPLESAQFHWPLAIDTRLRTQE